MIGNRTSIFDTSERWVAEMAFLKRIKNIKSRFFTQLLAFFMVFFVIMQLLNIYAYYELQRSFERSLATLQASVSAVISSSVN